MASVAESPPGPPFAASTFVEILRSRARQQPDRRAYTFLENGEAEEATLTYAELDLRARAIASMLQSAASPGDSAVLLLPSGLGYIAAFFGCLYAGVLPVPLYPPRHNRSLARIRAVVADARPAVAIGTARILSTLRNRLSEAPELQRLTRFAVDDVPAGLEERWKEPHLDANSLAFLQYTSGSTGTPKGVMVSHGNLVHNSFALATAFHRTPQSIGVSWLPMFHDMGLIESMLQATYSGYPLVLMSPESFLQVPIRWLRAISHYRATTSGAPNFAYDLCVRQIGREQRATLDLSSWFTAYSGAETVRAATLTRFTEAFRECGLRSEAFYPCYGLAEATLQVAGGSPPALPVIRACEKAAFERGRALEVSSSSAGAQILVGCGKALRDLTIAIVDPEKALPCATRELGEIWVAGPSIAQGYKDCPEETRETFGARLAHSGEGPFLRTGDLGFLDEDGELFIAGRIKDLIIIRGQNHYPQDIEHTVEQCSAAMRHGHGAAFSVDVDGDERLVVVQELDRHYKRVDTDQVIAAIQQAVADRHDLRVHCAVLVKPGTIPKTSSGKIQRRACRALFLEQGMSVVAQWTAALPAAMDAEDDASARMRQRGGPGAAGDARTGHDIEAWIVAALSQQLGMGPGDIEVGVPLARYGLDSYTALRLAGDLSTWLQRPVPINLVYAYPTVDALARHLAGEADSFAIPDQTVEPAAADEPLAIVGMGCRFPGGANSPERFWALLREGRDAITEVPRTRWDIDAYYDPDPDAPGKASTRWGGFVDAVDEFDAEFFGVAPREAHAMDPQQRLLLEVAWEALEDAGQAPTRLAGSRTGVFVGISTFDYAQLQHESGLNAYSGTGSAFSIAANRLSYVLGLQGPSLAVDTACSSSLVAVHLAAQSVHSGECRLALACGVNLTLSPENSIRFSKAHMLAPDGRCKTFDAAADGYVRGEGCGVIVLKRLSDALADGDRVLAVLRGSAVNQDGRSQGLTAPNQLAQEAVLREALTRARVRPAAVDYVEAHGTGTVLGDPIEVQALREVLGTGRQTPLRLGSVKTNVGHLEAAAGMAGLLKVVLALQHEMIPPHLHLKRLNPHILLDGAPIEIPTQLTPWPRGTMPRLAGVNSFGFGGTNAHVIVEEGPAVAAAVPVGAPLAERPESVLALSGKSEAALRAVAGRYADALATLPAARLGDFCFSVHTGRAAFAHRLAVVGADATAMAEQLRAVHRGAPAGEWGERRRAAPVVFVFPGQGAQYAGMGRALYEGAPVFREALQACAAVLGPLGVDLEAVLFGPEAAAQLRATAVAQPALVAVEYALAAQWRAWGIEPVAVVGHSVGELTAAIVAGVLPLAEGLRLAVTRGALMQTLPADVAMAAVFAAEATVTAALGAGAVTVAAVNGPAQVVIAGGAAAVAAVCAALGGAGVRTQPLSTGVAFHSAWVEPVLAALAAAAPVGAAAPARRWVSTVTGAVVTRCPAGYWRDQARAPVRFAAAVETLRQQYAGAVFLEVGPGRTLTAVGTETARGGERWVAPLRRGREWRATLEALAVLYVAGVEVAWAAYDAPYARRRVPVPTYPFQRQRYWFDSDLTAGAVTQTTARRGAIASPEEAAGHPLLGARVRAAVPTTLYESQWSLTTRPYVSEHRVYGAAVVPATAYVALVVAAATETAGGSTGGVVVEDLRLEAALALEAAPAVTVQVVVTPGEAESHEVQVLSLAAAGAAAGGRWRRHARAQVRLGPSTAPGSEAGASLEAVRARCQEVVAVPTLYADLAARGVTYGPLFRGLVGVWHGEAGEALGEVAVPVPPTGDAGWLHPAVLDATWQVLGADGWPARTADGDDVYVPVGVERVHVVGPVRGGRVWAHAVRRPGTSDRIVVGDVWVWDAAGQPVGVVEGITLQRVSRAQLLGEGSAVALADGRYEVVWRARPGREGAAGTADAAWLIVADRGGVGAAVAARLTQHGARCTTVDSDDDAAVEAALASSACSGVVHLGSLDVVADATATGAAVVAEQARGCGSVLRVVQALARGTTPAARVWVATQGAQAVTAGAAVAVAQAPAWGLGRVIALEHPELWGGLVDLDPAAPPMDAGAALAEAVLAADGEDQIALRGATRYVARLTRRPAPAIPSSGDEAVQLQVGTPGLLETLRLVPVPRRPPGPREVEIRVTAAGLNFLDVLSALGTLPIDRPGPLGHECAGEVVAVGAGVTDLATGDHVVALAAGCFGGYATTAADFVVRRPEGLTAENAASLPVAYLTARYGLEVLAGLRAGERVLIHAAAGGVGLAAVAVAQRIGAEVFATAGSAEKRAYLLGLGVRHVFDSRSLAFEGDVLAATGGTGVDVVLNSLAGEFIGASVRVLAPQGRFLEIGKRGVWDAAQIAAVRPGARCHVYDLVKLAASEPQRVRALLRETIEGVAAGRWPTLPRETFALSEAAVAFQLMAQGRHRGKLVLTLPASDAPAVVRADGTYVITGGWGGLGLAVAQWLVGQGARHLVLMGRHAPSAEAQQAVCALEDAGARVLGVRGDVGQAEDVARLVAARQAEGLPPVRGVVHAAGTLADGVVTSLTWDRFAEVLAAKVAGSWELHRQLQHEPLDWFVLFSSSAGILGSPGQGNHAAANAFLDALAHDRRAQGLPAVSINWGPWSGIGAAAARQVETRLAQRWAGVGTIAPAEGLRVLGDVLATQPAQLTVLPIDWTRFIREAAASTRPMLADIANAMKPSPERRVATEGIDEHTAWQRQLEALPHAQRRPQLQTYLQKEIAAVLGLGGQARPDPRQPVMELGFDSLMAVELRNRLATRLGRALPATLLFDRPTIEALTEYLLGDVLGLNEHEDPQRTDVEVTTRAAADEPIAIVGMGCRFPGGADSPEAFWSLLREGRDAITEVPRTRWDVDAYYDPDPDAPGKMNTRWGGFLGRVEEFDAEFFGIAPREARAMDPQQRLLLEVAWEALEHAGYAATTLAGTRTGVFVGIAATDYMRLRLNSGNAMALDVYTGTGSALSVASGRLSYVFGLQGPSLAVDTACSSSLVAVHLASQSLRSGECRLALAGGVNLILSPETTITFSKARMLAADGRCKTFDAAADGYVRGEGCGLVVLKRLSDALADGDRVLAVLRGSAVNQDGRSSTLTAPNGPAQEAMLREALARARTTPGAVSYVEAHGTGTALGDPIEVQALSAVFAADRETPLRLGTVKTNIGHLETAAGIAGLMKVVLALQHEAIPPHLHLTRLNPHISLGPPAEAGSHGLAAPIEIPTQLTPWPRGTTPRLAGVSSFGFSGTNAHVIVEEAPTASIANSSPVAERQLSLLALSARSEAALRAVAGRYAEALATLPATRLGDFCFSAHTGRAAFAHRLAVVGADAAEIAQQLRAVHDGRTAGVRGERQRAAPVVFVFPRQGTQYAGMGRTLYDREPVFRRALDACAALLAPLGVDLGALLFAPEAEPRLRADAVAQPALVVSVEYALAQLWRAWGIEPAAVVGHDVGKLAAAIVSGVVTLDDALRLAVTGGQLATDPGSSLPDPDSLRLTIGLAAGRDESRQVIETLAELYVAGVDVDWAAYDAPYQRQRVPLPTYPFQRQRYWIETVAARDLDGIHDETRWKRLTAAGRQHARAGSVEIAALAVRQATLNAVCRGYMRKALTELGVLRTAQRLEEVLESGRIMPRYAQLMERWLAALVDTGELRRDGATFVDLRPWDAAADLEASSVLEKESGPLGALVRRCGASLVPVLRGELQPHELLFPGGSPAELAQLYAADRVTGYYNGILAEVIAQLGEMTEPDRALRVLEVGAGTGGTTTWVLPRLPAGRTTYMFTDVSPWFLSWARETFRGVPGLQFDVLDLERAPGPQGYAAGSYDVVIAANVLHATRDLRRTLQHVRALVAPGGLLLLYEITAYQPLFDVIFGLVLPPLADAARRDAAPFLTQSEWRHALRDAGFVAVEEMCDEGALGQQVLVARAAAAEAAQSAADGRARLAQANVALHPVLGQRLQAAVGLYESQWSLTTRPYVSEHQVYGAAVVPATAYVALAVAVATETAGGSPAGVVVEDLRLEAALQLEADRAVTVQVVVTPTRDGAQAVQVLSLGPECDHGDAWRMHARGQVRSTPETTLPGHEPLEAIRARCHEDVALTTFYAEWAARGVTYGPMFQRLVALWRGPDGDALGEVEVPEGLTADGAWIHPAVLDATWQVLGGGGWPARTADGDDVYVPVGVERVHIARPVRGGRVWAHAVRRPGASDRTVVGDVWVWDAAGQPVGVVEGITLQRVSRAQLLGEDAAVALADGRYEVVWRARPGREGAAGTADAAWLIVADGGGVGAAVAVRLTQHGARCTTVDSNDAAAVEAALATTAWAGVVHLGSLDVVADATATGAAVVAEQARGCGSVLRVLQALARGTTPAARVWVATQGAQAVTAGAAVAVAQAPAWGLGRVIALEHPALWGGLVDLDPLASPADAGAALAEAVLAADGEDQIALRGATRYVARLTRRPAPAIPSSGDEAVQLQVGTPGLLETLRLVPVPRRPPGPREVEIRVTAAGLNFRDVMRAMGVYPDSGVVLGSECAGEVVAVGAGVPDLSAGDDVVALAAGCFGGYVTTDADFVVRRPSGLDAQNAASLPAAYLTARYGLEVLAGLRAGERVLIHAAAGGVGLAAVAVAQRIGAEVFATAGSAEKRAYLTGLGVRHVFDSRSLAFESEVRAATGGTGVDVVLNSLAGEFIGASVRVLAPEGRFLEIGKRGVWDAAQVAAVRPAAQYFVYDMGEVAGSEPARVRALLTETLEGVVAGRWPALPRQTFALADAAAAFRLMAQGRHRGKLVLTPSARPAPAAVVRADGTYVITGGWGGLGLAVAQWLVGQGARHLVLMGRHAPSEEAQQAVRALEDAGARVLGVRGDVGQAEDVARLVAARAAEGLPPVRGVVHAAGTLADGVVTSLTWDRFAEVFGAKVAGSWELHRQLQHEPLDWFVLFSSSAAILGSPGQGNHAAANAFLDALAHDRRAQGLPAVSINWGPWSGIGAAAARQVETRLAQRWAGVGTIAPAEGLRVLGDVLAMQPPQLVVLPIDWRAFARSAAGVARPFLTELAGTTAAPQSPGVTLRLQLETLSVRERRRYVQALLQQHVSRVLGLNGDAAPSTERALAELGLDSLMAIELRNLVTAEVGHALPATLLFDYPTIDALTDHLLRDVLAIDAQPDGPQPPGPTPWNIGTAMPLEAIEGLSEDEARRLLEEL